MVKSDIGWRKKGGYYEENQSYFIYTGHNFILCKL